MRAVDRFPHTCPTAAHRAWRASVPELCVCAGGVRLPVARCTSSLRNEGFSSLLDRRGGRRVGGKGGQTHLGVFGKLRMKRHPPNGLADRAGPPCLHPAFVAPQSV